MKNEQSKGLNPKHSISERFKASTRGFRHFLKKIESERNTAFSVIIRLIPRIHTKHLANVILGFIPRIHAEHTPMDTRVTPEYDNRKRMCLKPENDHKRSLIKGLDVVCQCAARLERRVQSSTRVIKAQAVNRQTNECIEIAESGVDKVVSSCEKNPNVHKTYMNFLRQRKTALDAPLHAVSSGRSMIEMLGVLAIIGVLSVGGIQGYSKAMTKFKINKTMQQIAEIATNIRTLYIQQNDFNSLSNTTAVQMGIVPDDLKTSDGEYGTVITNAFGSPVGITGNSYARGTNSDEFVIRFLNVTKEGCIALATADWGNSASSGLIAIGIGFFSGDSDTMLNESYVYKNCTSQGEYGVHGYYACANHLPMSPALAAQYCTDTGENWGYDNSFGIKFSK